MSGLNNMKHRLDYYGGSNQQGRMNEDKVRSLKKALLYSYQAATARLNDDREFRCLINPDKLKEDYDNKIISIPFKDINVSEVKTGIKTLQGIESIGVKPGDVFEWKENGSYWIIYLRRLEETAYFRAEIRRCQYELDVEDTKYKVYVKGPAQETMLWTTRQETGSWNHLNYTLVMMITHNEQTEAFFHRFTKIKFLNKNWEVQAIDNISTEGIIAVYLKEDYSNTILDERIEEIKENQETDFTYSAIDGPDAVYPYDSVIFTIENYENGQWFIDNEKVEIVTQNNSQAKAFVKTGKSGKFTISYKVNNVTKATKEVVIKSL